MESVADVAPLVVILGPTASGKSALALQLAEQFNGEIISADSRAIYKGMDIGTAKPSPEEQASIPHHLLDVITPDQSFSVADFQRLARGAIEDIVARGRVPFLAGGSGLYIDSVIYNFSFRPSADKDERKRLQAFPVEELQAMLQEQEISLPLNERNPVHLIRALETKGVAGTSTELRPNTLVLGISLERDELEGRIRDRVDKMVSSGFIEEVKQLSGKYGWSVPALRAPGYKAFRLYLNGQLSLDEAKQQFVQYDLQYAKRQKTWFRRSSDIHWISNSEEAVDLVTTFLNK